jgi:cyanate permease
MLREGINEKWSVLSLGWLIYFSFGLINTAIAPLVSEIMIELSLNYTQMGVLMGAWQLIYIFSAQPLGLLIDRLGVRLSLLIGVIIISTSSILRGMATGFGDLFAYIALFGLGGPLISIGTPKLISIWFQGKERGTASGINATGPILGNIIALSITNSQVLPLVGSWRRVFFLYGVIGYIVTLLWFLFGKTGKKETKDTVEQVKTGTGKLSFFSLLKHKEIWVLVWVGIVYFFSTHGIKNWMPKILELKGYSPENAGYATSLLSIMGLLGSLTVPRLSHSIRSKKLTITLVLLLSSVGILFIALSQGSFLYLGILLVGYSVRSIMPLLTLTLMDINFIGTTNFGAAGGLLFSVGELGGFMGPFLMGYLKDITGSFVSGLVLLSITNIITIILIKLIELNIDN